VRPVDRVGRDEEIKKSWKETRQSQTGYSPRPLTLSQCHVDLCVWSGPKSSFIYQVSSKSVPGFRSRMVSKFAFFHLTVPPINNWGPHYPFSMFIDHFATPLNVNFKREYLRNETWHSQTGTELETTKGPVRWPKIPRTLVHKRL